MNDDHAVRQHRPDGRGRFALTTDGDILANTTDEGAKVGPMALIGLGK